MKKLPIILFLVLVVAVIYTVATKRNAQREGMAGSYTEFENTTGNTGIYNPLKRIV